MIEWLIVNWLKIAIPVLAFVATYAVGLWLRRIVDSAFEHWAAMAKWEGSLLVVRTARRPFLFWFLLLGIIIAIQASILPAEAKSMTVKAIGSLFILSLGWVAIALSEQLLQLYLPKIKAPQPTHDLVMNAVRVIIIVISVLVVLDTWGMPTTPLLLLIAVIVLAAMLVLRNAAPNLLAAFQLWDTEIVKEGDYIKLETGEEGYVVEINLNNTRLKALDESTVTIPNSRLLQQTIVNYGHPTKIARELFSFNSRTQFAGLTGHQVRKLGELADITAAEKADNGKAAETKSTLSEREKEIARLIAEGVGNREMAQKLFIAENTVKVHIKNILRKLELRNRQQLAAYTVLQNWATTDEGKTQNEQD